MFGLFIYLMMLIFVQSALQYFLGGVLGLSVYWVLIISDVVFALLYAFMRHRGMGLKALKQKSFYSDFFSTLGLFVLVNVLDFVLTLFLGGVLGLNFIWIALIIDAILSFLFAFVNYPGPKKMCFKDMRFHRMVLIYFLVFVVFTLLDIFVL